MKMKAMVTRTIALLVAVCGLQVFGATDEAGLTPYNWVTFDDLTVGDIADGTSAANQGSSTTAMVLPAGSAVTVSGTDVAWQFGSASNNKDFVPNGSSVKSTTYATKLNLNSGTYSSCYIWGVNGKLYGGPCLTVNGSGSSYTVSFGRHDNGSVKATYVTYTVPSSKISGFHWYVMTIDSNGTEVHAYVDGVEVGSTTSATLTADQNAVFGWGQLGNAGTGKTPSGLQISDFRMYTQVLTEAQIEKISGVTSGTVTITEDTKVSEINTAHSSYQSLTLAVDSGKTITFDENFTASKVTITSTGAINLKGSDANEGAVLPSNLVGVDVSGVTGGVTYGSTVSRAISINFGSGAKTGAAMNSLSGNDGSYAGNNIPCNSWNDYNNDSLTGATLSYESVNGSQTSLSGVTLSYSGRGGNYRPSVTASPAFLNGYIDDGSGSQVAIKVSGIPYTKYAVILYYQSDSNSSYHFGPVTINGTTYTCANGIATATTAGATSPLWGTTDQAQMKYGVNAVRLDGLTAGELTILPAIYVANSTRGTVAALQIVETVASLSSVPTATPTEGSTGANWSALSWDPTVSNWNDSTLEAILKVNGEQVVSADTTVSLNKLVINKSSTDAELTLSGASGKTVAASTASIRVPTTVNSYVSFTKVENTADAPIVIDATAATQTYTAASTFKSMLYDSGAYVNFLGDGSYGVALSTTSDTSTHTSHMKFVGGTHKLTAEGSQTSCVYAGTDPEAPYLRVANDTTLNLNTHDFMGWDRAQSAAWVLRVDKGGTVNFEHSKTTDGTTFFNRRVYLEPGANLYVGQNGGSGNWTGLSFNGGGTSQSTANFYVAAPGTEDSAPTEVVIAPRTGVSSKIFVQHNNPGFGVDVASGSKMTFNIPVYCSTASGSYNGTIGKWGSGTVDYLDLSGFVGTVAANGGTTVLHTGLKDNTSSKATVAKDAILKLDIDSSLSNQAIAGDVSNAGTVYKTGSGAISLTGTASGTGTLTANAGTINLLGTSTAVGTIYANDAGTVNIGDATHNVTATITRIEMGDNSNSGHDSTLAVASGSTLKITSTSDTSSYKSTGLLLGEWVSSTTANVDGKLLATGVTMQPGNTGYTLNIGSSGVVAVKGVGVSTAGSGSATVNLNGGKLVLGENGFCGDHTVTANLKGGTIGTASSTVTFAKALALSENTTTLFDTSKYTVGDDNTVTRGTTDSDTTTITVSGTVTGSGAMTVDGLGTLAFTGTMSGYSGKITLASGTITVSDDCSLAENTIVPTTGYSLNSSKTDTTTTYTLTKQNDVTVTILSVDNAASVTVTADGTTVEGTENVYTVPYGSKVVVTYTAASGYLPATSTVTYDNVTANREMTSDEKPVIKSATTTWTGSGSWTDTANWDNGVPTADHTAVVALGASDTITMNGTVDPATLTLSGLGRVIFTAVPSTTWQTALQGENWKGTAELDGLAFTSGDGLKPELFGNASSTVALKGCSGYFYAAGDTPDVTLKPAIELIDSESAVAFTRTNGWNGKRRVYAALKGTGTFNTVNSNDTLARVAQVYLFTEETSSFGGSILMDTDIENSTWGAYNVYGPRVVFGSTTTDTWTLDSTTSAATTGMIEIDAGYTATLAAGKTWQTYNGVSVLGTLNLGRGATIVGPLTIGENGQVKVDVSDLTATTKIASWTLTEDQLPDVSKFVKTTAADYELAVKTDGLYAERNIYWKSGIDWTLGSSESEKMSFTNNVGDAVTYAYGDHVYFIGYNANAWFDSVATNAPFVFVNSYVNIQNHGTGKHIFNGNAVTMTSTTFKIWDAWNGDTFKDCSITVDADSSIVTGTTSGYAAETLVIKGAVSITGAGSISITVPVKLYDSAATFTVPENTSVTVESGDSNYNTTSSTTGGLTTYSMVHKPVAKIGDTEYTTLQEAVNAASTETTSTITMLLASDETVAIDRDVIITEPGEQLATATLNIGSGKHLTLTFDATENRTFTVNGADTSSVLEINTTGKVGFDNTTRFKTLTLKINSAQGYGTWLDGVICDSSVDLDVETTLHIEKNAATVGNLTGTSTSASIADTALTVNLTDNCTYAGSISPTLTVNGSGKTLTLTGSTGAITLGGLASVIVPSAKDNVTAADTTYYDIKTTTGDDSTVTYLARRLVSSNDAGTTFTFNSETVTDSLLDSDLIVYGNGKFQGGIKYSQFGSHDVKITTETDMGKNDGLPANANLTITYKDFSDTANRKGVYLYGCIGENAVISGEGALFLDFTRDDCSTRCTISNGVVISCNTGFQGGERTATIAKDATVTMSGAVYFTSDYNKIYLEEGATLKMASAAPAGRIVTSVEGKAVSAAIEASTGYTVYSLVDTANCYAKVGDTYYVTLADAIAGANGAQINIIKDGATYAPTATGAAANINVGEYTLNITPAANVIVSLTGLTGSGAVTIGGEGTVVITGDSTGYTGTLTVNGVLACECTQPWGDTATVTVNGTLVLAHGAYLNGTDGISLAQVTFPGDSSKLAVVDSIYADGTILVKKDYKGTPKSYEVADFTFEAYTEGVTHTQPTIDEVTYDQFVFTPEVDGAACLLDFTFTNTVRVTSTNRLITATTSQWQDFKKYSLKVNWDSGTSIRDYLGVSSDVWSSDGQMKAVYTNWNETTKQYTALSSLMRPYRGTDDDNNADENISGVYFLPTNRAYTAAIAGTIPSGSNTCFVAFGNTYRGLFLATGKDANELDLIRVASDQAKGSDSKRPFSAANCTVLTTMKVPHGDTVQHTVIFETEDHQVYTIYVDGKLWTRYDHGSHLELRHGFQIGGWTGGDPSDSCYSKISVNNASNSYISAVRIYDGAMGPNAVAQFAAEFPYVTPAESYSRVLDADGTWKQTGAWTKDEETFEVPADESPVYLTNNVANTVRTLTVNVDAEIESLTFGGEGAITLATSGGTITCDSVVNVDTVVTNEYGALDISQVPVVIASGKWLTIDLSHTDMGSYTVVTTNRVTGTMTEPDGEYEDDTLEEKLANWPVKINFPSSNRYEFDYMYNKTDSSYYVILTPNSTHIDDSQGQSEGYIDVTNSSHAVIATVTGRAFTIPAGIKTVSVYHLDTNISAAFTADSLKITDSTKANTVTPVLDEGGSVKVGNDTITVKPVASAITAGSDTTKSNTVVGVKSIPGLWYGIQTSTDNDTFTQDYDSILQASGTELALPTADSVMASDVKVRYYKISVAGSRADFGTGKEISTVLSHVNSAVYAAANAYGMDVTNGVTGIGAVVYGINIAGSATGDFSSNMFEKITFTLKSDCGAVNAANTYYLKNANGLTFATATSADGKVVFSDVGPNQFGDGKFYLCVDPTILSTVAISGYTWGDGSSVTVNGTTNTVPLNMIANTPAKDGLKSHSTSGSVDVVPDPTIYTTTAEKTGYRNYGSVYRIPAIAKGANSIVALFDCRYLNHNDLGTNWAGKDDSNVGYCAIDTAACESTDAGQTWTKPSVVIDVPNFTTTTVSGSTTSLVQNTSAARRTLDIGDPCIGYLNGTFYMMAETGNGLQNSWPNQDLVMYSRAAVVGSAWGSRTSVQEAISNALVTAGETWPSTTVGILQGPGHAIVTADNKLLFPMQLFYLSNGTRYGRCFAAMMTVTADGTKTWTATKLTDNSTSIDAQENSIAILDNGAWYMICKNGSANQRYVYVSTNHVDWTRMANQFVSETPRVQGSILKVGTKDSKGIYVAAMDTGLYGNGGTDDGRSDLKLFIGTDAGTAIDGYTATTTGSDGSVPISWCSKADAIMLYDGYTEGQGYNSIVQIDDTHVGVLFEAAKHIYFKIVDISAYVQ